MKLNTSTRKRFRVSNKVKKVALAGNIINIEGPLGKK